MKNNLLKNPGFSIDNGAEWILNDNALIESVDNNVATIDCSKGTSNCGIYQNPLANSKFGHLYYVSQLVKSDSSNMKFTIQLESVSDFFHDTIGDKDWHCYSKMILYDETVKGIVENIEYHAYVIYAQNEFASKFYVKNPVYVDLTLMFG